MVESDSPKPEHQPTAVLGYVRSDVRAPGATAQALLRPAGWLLAVAAAAATIVTLVVAADVLDLWIIGFLLSVLLWLGVGAGWALRVFGHVAAVAAYGRSDGGNAPRRWRWAIAPALFIATYLTCRAGVPSAAAFALSRPAMERSAVAALAHPTAVQPPMSVGLFGTSTPEVDRGAVYFKIAGMSGMDRDGYAYSPSGPPAEYRTWPVGGPWYRWHEKF